MAAVLGFTPTVNTTVLCALAVLVLATVINLTGTKMLSYFAIFGFTAELIGALVVGVWLLLTERHHSLGVLFHSFGAQGHHSFLYAFLAASLIGVYQYYGFEACGDVAEEVRNPGVQIPKAMRRTIYIGGAAATFVCLSLILSVVDFGAVIRGEDTDPIRRRPGDGVRRCRFENRARRRADLVRVVCAEPAGRRQPADLLLRPRRHDRRLQALGTLRQEAPRPSVRAAGRGRHPRRADRRIDLLHRRH